MDPLTSLYTQLQRRSVLGEAPTRMPEPPQLEDWLRYWDDNDTDVGNLRNFRHWLERASNVRQGQS